MSPAIAVSDAMSPRTAVAALSLAALLVLAGCTGGLVGGPDAQDPDQNAALDRGDGGATVSVAGQATVEAEPDAATVELTVAARGDDPRAVRDRLASNASAVREALESEGLDAEQIRTEHFRIRENHRAHEDPDAPAYVGAHALVVELEDTERVGEVIDAAVESGPVRVDGVTFGLSDERREELRDQALTQAVEDARGEAELVASAEGLEISSAKQIRTDEVHVDRTRGTVYQEAAATPTAGADAATRVESDEVTVSVTVHLVYNATQT